jgi:hypothetical protein
MRGPKFLSNFIWQLCHLLMSIDTSHCCYPFLPYIVLEYFPWMIEVNTLIHWYCQQLHTSRGRAVTKHWFLAVFCNGVDTLYSSPSVLWQSTSLQLGRVLIGLELLNEIWKKPYLQSEMFNPKFYSNYVC